MATTQQVQIKITADGRLAQAEISKTERALTGLSTGGREVARSLNVLAGAFGLAFGASTVRQVLQTADQYTLLQGRIAGATRATGDYARVSQELATIARNTGAALEDTVSTFTALARSAPELGVTNAEMLKLTQTVQQLGVISGATATEMSNGLRQFSQAMAGGVLRAEEFNSILDQLPELANAIAVGMGKTVGQLRAAVVEGTVLSRDIFAALEGQAAEINRRFGEMPYTMARGWEEFKAGITVAIADANNLLGITNAIGQALANVGAGLRRVTGNLTEAERFNTLLQERVRLEEAMARTLRNPRDRALDAGRRERIAAINEELNALSDLRVEREKGDAAARAEAEAEAEFAAAVTASEASVKAANAEYQKWLEKLQTKAPRAGRAAKAAVDDLDRSLQSLIRRYLPAVAAAQDYAEAERAVAAAVAARRLSQEQGLEILAAMRAEQAGLAEEGRTEVDAWAEVWRNGIERLDDAFANLWKDLFNGTKSTLESLKRLVTDWLAEVAHALLTKPLVVSITTALTGGASGVASAATGGGGGLGGLGSLGSLLSGNSIGSGLAGGMTRMGIGTGGGFWTGFGTNLISTPNWAFGLGGIAGGLLGSFLAKGPSGQIGSMIGSGAGTAIGAGLFGSVGGLLGGPLGAIGGALIGNVFGDKTEPRAYFQATANRGFEDDVFASSSGFGLNFGLAQKSHKVDAAEYAQTFQAMAALADSIAGLVGPGVPEAVRTRIEALDNSRAIGPKSFDAATGADAILQQLVAYAAETGDQVATVLRDYAQAAGGSMEAIAAAVARVQQETALLDQALAQAETALAEPLGPYAQRLAEINAVFDQALPLAAQYGRSLEQLTAAQTRLVAGLREDFETELADALLALTDPMAAALQALNREFTALRGEAQALGADTAALETLYALREQAIRQQYAVAEAEEVVVDLRRLEAELLQAQGRELEAVALLREVELEGLTAAEQALKRQIWALQDAAAAQSELTTSSDALARSLSDAATVTDSLVQQARERYIEALQRERDTLLETQSRFASFAKSLREFADSLRLSDLSPMSPEAMFADARGQFQGTARRALLGDLDALERLSEVSQSYLEQARAMYASAPEYAAAFAEVQSALTGAADLSLRQSDRQSGPLAALDQQLAALGQVETATLSVAEAQRQYLAALAAQTAEARQQHGELITAIERGTAVETDATRALLARLDGLLARVQALESTARRTALAA